MSYERAKFEAWLRGIGRGSDILRHVYEATWFGGESVMPTYRDNWTEGQWIGWQARAALAQAEPSNKPVGNIIGEPAVLAATAKEWLRVAVNTDCGEEIHAQGAAVIDRLAALAQASGQLNLSLPEMVLTLIKRTGGVRALSRATGLDPSYISRLSSGEKDAPSDETLSVLGLARVVTYRLAEPLKPPATGASKFNGEQFVRDWADYWRERALKAEQLCKERDQYRDAYLNMRAFAEANGLDTTTYGHKT